jgi:hypothetical protein
MERIAKENVRMPLDDKVAPGVTHERVGRFQHSNTLRSMGNDASEHVVETDEKGRAKKIVYMDHTEADKMRNLFMHSCRAYSANKERPNPIWMDFPGQRCQKPIRSAAEMRTLLDHYSHSDEVMVVRYHQAGCTACNALDKVSEMACREMRVHTPGMHFYEVQRESDPALTEGLLRFPQVKAFNGGAWQDIDFKPPAEYRESVYRSIEGEVRDAQTRGNPITAIQAEEMFFSVAGPAMHQVLEDSLYRFYNNTQVRVHNYWKQIAARRAWFFKKYVEPRITDADRDRVQGASLFGEAAGEQLKQMLEKEKVAATKEGVSADAPQLQPHKPADLTPADVILRANP